MKTIEDEIKAVKRKLTELKQEKKKEEQRRLMEEAAFKAKSPKEKAKDLWNQAYATAYSSTCCGRGLDEHSLDEDFTRAKKCRIKLWEEYKSIAREAVRYEQEAESAGHQ